jgi:hypothetical protein
MNVGSTGQTPGGIYELIARGQKDEYFFSEPTKGAFTPFANQYQLTTPFLKETKTVVSVNEPAFGQTVEFELERFGDILTDVWLQIRLPSWVPDSVQPGEIYVDENGDTYNWHEAAGFFLLKHIQVLQGQMVVLETTGEALYWTSGVRRRQAAADLVRRLGGDYSLGPKPTGMLRVRVPFPGCQGDRNSGFPMCAVPNKEYRVRVTLRKVDELIDGSPWGKVFYLQGSEIPIFTACSKETLGSPKILLELTQAYIGVETRDTILKTAEKEGIRLPFITHFQQIYGLQTGVKPYLLEARHPSEGMYIYVRTRGTAMKNISGGAISSIRFTIAGRDREFDWSQEIWTEVMDEAKACSSSPVQGLAMINWSLGNIHRPMLQDMSQRRPEGTVNFSEADKPTLYITSNVDAGTAMNMDVVVILEGWRVYEIQSSGYGRVSFL